MPKWLSLLLSPLFPNLLSCSNYDHIDNWSTLQDFGYHFNQQGELRHVETNDKFQFNVFQSHSANQERYEKLGRVVEKHIYKLLEEEGLIKEFVPRDASANEGSTFVFRSQDAFTCDKLILLVHGSGVVRAGQWARKLVINLSLETGSQLPYIRKARELGYGVLVLNTNDNKDRKGRGIRGSSSPEEHFEYVWNNFVTASTARHVAIVAHSYGGYVATRAGALMPSVREKTFALALTDSVHFGHVQLLDEDFHEWMKQSVCNWASSSSPLNSLLRNGGAGECPVVSAGTMVHEETSWKAFTSVWRFIQEKWKEMRSKEGNFDQQVKSEL